MAHLGYQSFDKRSGERADRDAPRRRPWKAATSTTRASSSSDRREGREADLHFRRSTASRSARRTTLVSSVARRSRPDAGLGHAPIGTATAPSGRCWERGDEEVGGDGSRGHDQARFLGSAGQSFAPSSARPDAPPRGDANDTSARGSRAGRSSSSRRRARLRPRGQRLIGNVAFYGGRRRGVHPRRGRRAVLRPQTAGLGRRELIGDPGCEYMTAGRSSSSGERTNFGAGMSGGVAWVRRGRKFPCAATWS